MCGACFGALGCAAIGTADGSLLIVDGSDRSISLWDGGTFTPASKGKDKKSTKVSVASCWSSSDRDTVVVGDSIGNVRVLKVKANKLTESGKVLLHYGDKNKPSPPVSVRSVCLASNGSKLLVGTYRCEVVEVKLPLEGDELSLCSGASTSPSHSVINQGHFKDELWYTRLIRMMRNFIR